MEFHARGQKAYIPSAVRSGSSSMEEIVSSYSNPQNNHI
jgi:hypothetical protein